MTPMNVDYLNDNLKFLGFGERSILNQHLEEQVLRGEPAFELYTEAFYDPDTKLEAKLYFTRGRESDYYFFNKYDALLRYSGGDAHDKAQTFYINKGHGVTLKESFNLLQGRSVFKNLISKGGIAFQSWIQLNFEARTPGNNYPFLFFRPTRFSLEAALKKYPIREMDYENLRGSLIRSLQRGNLHPVIFDYPDRIERNFIAADPAKDSINVYPMATRAGAGRGSSHSGRQEKQGEPEETGANPVPHMMLEEEAPAEPRSKASTQS